MKRGRRILLIVVACGIIAAITVFRWPGEKEPEYQGKKLSEWLLYEKPASAASSAGNAQREAIREIGPSALPWLLRWVQYKSPPWRQKLSRILGEDWRVELSQAAWSAFRVLGPKASDGIPELTRMMNDPKSPFMNQEPIFALADLGDRAFTPVLSVLADAKHRDRAAAALIIGINGQWGTNRVRAVPVLLECLHAQDEQVAGCAAIALGRLALQPDLVVPELEKSLSDRRAIVRRGAVWSLGVFAGRAPSVGPSLIQALGDTDRSVRVVATNAVREIAPDVLRAVELRQIQEGIGKSETKDPSP